MCRCWISTFVGRILIKFKPSTGQLKCKADRIWSRNGTTYWSVSTMWERDRNRMTRFTIAREPCFGWRGGGAFFSITRAVLIWWTLTEAFMFLISYFTHRDMPMCVPRFFQNWRQNRRINLLIRRKNETNYKINVCVVWLGRIGVPWIY